MITGMNNIVGYEAKWGAITGTLSEQTDLQTALNGKVPYQASTGNCNTFADGITIVTDTSTSNLPASSRMAVLTFTVLSSPLRKVQVAFELSAIYRRSCADNTSTGWSAWTNVG